MSRVKEENRIRRKKGTVPPSKVWGIRMDEPMWDKIDEVAAREGISRNALIVKAVTIYLEHSNGRK